MIKTSKKVCMVVGNPFVNDSQVLKEAQSLSRNGYSVTVYALSGEGLPVLEDKEGFLIKRLPIRNYSPIHIKFWRAYTQFYSAYKQLFKEKADVYHAHDADTLLICYLAAGKNNAKLVYDFHEYWRKKTLWYGSFFGRIWGKIENKILVLIEYFVTPRADALITVNDSLADEFGRNNRVKERPTVLFNTPSYTTPDKKDRALLRKKVRAGLEDKLAIFLGGFSKNRGLENLIKQVLGSY